MKEIINFKAGRFVISFEILNILMTEKYEGNASEVPSGDRTLLGVINYQQVPTPIYDMGYILEGTTAAEKNEALIRTLNEREQEHIDWIDALQESVDKGKTFTKARDPKQCSFSKWYTNFKSENDDLNHILTKFDEPHTKFHALADNILNLVETSGKEAGLKALKTARKTVLVSLQNLFDAARDIVESSYKPVIVYTTVNGVTPCLGFLVDSVDDALVISEEDIKSFTNSTGIQFMGNLNLPKMISGLVTKDNVNSLLIDPSSIKDPIAELESA